MASGGDDREGSGNVRFETDERFIRFLRNSIVSVFLHTNIALCLLFLISYLNYVKSGAWLALLPYLPTVLLLVGVRAWHALSPRTLVPAARLLLDVTSLVGVLGATAVSVIFRRLDVESLNAPVQISLVVAGAFALYPKRSQNLLRNFLLTACAFGAMYALDRSYATRIVAQYPVGFLLGSFAGHYLLESRKGQFLEVTHARSSEAHALGQLKKMVLPHQMERISVGDTLEETMPERVGNAYVIKFDVMASSLIRHDRFPEVLHDAFCDCYGAMAENYTKVPLQANGYPVKWMGDGFLCSVGFPLAVPDGFEAADLADGLAERFCEIFCRHMTRLEYCRRLCCGAGIAKGTLEGFYPASGPRLYDLRGTFSDDPLMLATRYEQLRKTILSELKRDESILVIAEAVFASLSPARRRLYQAWDMTGPAQGVRDDPGARTAYYRLLPCVEAAH